MSLTGDRIRSLRQQKDLTLKDVAECLGVGPQAVFKYEQGSVTNIPLENIEKMAALFCVSPCYLAGWDGSSSGLQSETVEHRPFDLQLFSQNPDEARLIEAYRGAEDQARKYALQILENNQAGGQDGSAGQMA